MAQLKNYQHQIDTKVITVKPKKDNCCMMKKLTIIRSNILGYYDIVVPDTTNLNDFISELQNSDEFDSVDFNYLSILTSSSKSPTDDIDMNAFEMTNRNAYAFLSTIIPNDSLYSEQAWLQKIQVDKAWELTMGSPSVKVAIIDTGIDTTHVDLGMGTDGYSNISASPGINCDLWWSDHGTICAGIIGAKTNNGKGIAGIAGGNHNNGATIYPYFVTHFPNIVEWNQVDNYILDATTDGAKIIIIGFWTDECNSSLISAINYAYNNGVTIISGSGYYNNPNNSVPKPVVYPAALDKVIAVGAAEMFSTFGQDYRRIWHSAYGPELDLVAPGYKVFSTLRYQQYSHELSGSDYAAAHVAGVVALMLSVNSQLTPTHIKQILRNTATKNSYYSFTNGSNEEVGCGLLDAYAAVDLAQYYISGNDTLCLSDVYTATGLPSSATVTWTLSGSNASKFNLVQNSPSANKCTITKKANAVFSSSSFTLPLTENIYQGGTLIKTKTKTLTCNNGFACTYQQAAHSSYGINYPAITETQMTSATNYVYPGGTVSLQSNYFRGKEITASGTYDQFHHIYNQNVVTFSLPPYTSNPLIINVPASGCDEALQLTFYPMSYYSMGSYSATLSVVSEQEYRISLVRNEHDSAEDTVGATRTTAENSETDGKVSWTVVAVNALTGRKVLSTEPEGTDYVLSTAGWESGLYVLRVIVGGEVVATQKIHVK